MSMSETELIRRLTRDLPADSSVLTGDDCAVLIGVDPPPTDASWKASISRNTSPEAIGRKALARALSDIAAMATNHALVTLGVHSDMKPDLIEAVYQGLRDYAQEHRVNIVGETTTLPQLTLSSP